MKSPLSKWITTTSLFIGAVFACSQLHAQISASNTIPADPSQTTPSTPGTTPAPSPPPVRSILNSPKHTWIFRNVKGNPEFNSVAIRVFQNSSFILEGRMCLYKNGQRIESSCPEIPEIISFTLQAAPSPSGGILEKTYLLKSTTGTQADLGYLRFRQSRQDRQSDLVVLRFSDDSPIINCPSPAPASLSPSPDPATDDPNASTAAARHGCDEPPIDDMGEEETFPDQDPKDPNAPPVDLPPMP